MQNEPLVSCGVLTYNSANTVIETLESIKAQTYQHLELVISDDCSQDNTVTLCEDWVKKNKGRFVRTEIITVGKNTGISANGNRLRRACRAEWVRSVAGDDALLPTCVEDNMKYVYDHPNALIVFSRAQCFGDMSRVAVVERGFHYGFFSLTVREQYLRLLLGSNFASPAVFTSRKLNEMIENDESIPLVDDLPRWLNITGAGVKMHFFNKETVKYRVGNSISLSKTPSPLWIKSQDLLKAHIQHLVNEENWLYRRYYKGIKRLQKGHFFDTILHYLNLYTWYMWYLLMKMKWYDHFLNMEFNKKKR